MIDVKITLAEAEEKMEEAVMYLDEALAHIRAGKAIMDSDVGITPDNNGEIIRLTIPPLTEERRKQLAKQCGKECEQAKVSIRNARRDTNDKLKKAIKDGLSEDLEKDAEGDLQKMHDKFIKKVEELLANKEKEIMTV